MLVDTRCGVVNLSITAEFVICPAIKDTNKVKIKLHVIALVIVSFSCRVN